MGSGSAGFLDTLGEAMGGQSGRSRSTHRRTKKRRSHSRSRSRSRSSSHRRGSKSFAGGFFGAADSNYNKHNSSKSSFFGLPNISRSSMFGTSRSSYYKRSPRQGFMQRAMKQVKRLFRDLVHYAKRHPWKVFFLVIMPLVTGGALTALLARFGLRIPPSLERMLGMASRAATGDPFGVVGDAVRMAGDIGGGSRAAPSYGGGSGPSYGGAAPSYGGGPSYRGGASYNGGGASYRGGASYGGGAYAGGAYGGARVDRGRDGGLQWERRSTTYNYNSRDRGGNGGWEDGLRTVSKMFS